jgi:hypothetical protein
MSRIEVSDHAIVRYLERALGVDTHALRAEIVTADTVRTHPTIGNGRYPCGRGCKAVIEEGIVVTVVK